MNVLKEIDIQILGYLDTRILRYLDIRYLDIQSRLINIDTQILRIWILMSQSWTEYLCLH